MSYLRSEESNIVLMKNIVHFLVDYELENGREFPNTSWSTTNLVEGYYINNPRELYYNWVDKYPEFFVWVSVLANRRVNLRDIYHSVRRIIQAKKERRFNEAIKNAQDEVKFFKKFRDHHYKLFSVEAEVLSALEELKLK